jgi:signal transduction histidine kinase
MSVRLKIALTIFFTGALTAIGVIATVLFAFQRFEQESIYQRADEFLHRVGTTYTVLLDQQQRNPNEFGDFLRSLVFFEPNSQLYLLDLDGNVLASSSARPVAPGYRVAMSPVRAAAGEQPMPYVMGDDPERPGERSDAVIAALPLARAVIRPDQPVAGYLYLVCQKPLLPEGGWQRVRSTFAKPALAAVVAVVLLATLLTAWITASVTRPLRRLTQAVAAIERDGLRPDGSASALLEAPAPPRHGDPSDEFGQLARGFRAMLDTLRMQWDALRRLDHFRREGVSNLSHDLRSPLTATATCLETLDRRWQGDPAREPDRELLDVALRNTRNAARLVQSLGDLAQLDEPQFELRRERVDVAELLDDIALRFTARATAQGVTLATVSPPEGDGSASDAPIATLDVQLVERAVANLIDNALKACAAGARIELSVRSVRSAGAASAEKSAWVEIAVADTGAGMSPEVLAHLFERYHPRPTEASGSATGSTYGEGRGLGLAIVKRIAELHDAQISVESSTGEGTRVHLRFRADPASFTAPR